MFRVVHFSDIHVFHAEAAWRAPDWFSKRLTGWVNLKYLPRGKQFRETLYVLKRLVDDMYARKPDLLLFTGDAASLGVEEEFALAAEVLRVGAQDAPPGMAVPGNHDYYTRRAVSEGLFERYFAPWLVGERVTEHTYPFGRQAGPVYLLGVNSSKPSLWMWDSTGRVGPDQLERLRQLLHQPHVRQSPKILATHYPIALPSGRPEKRHRRLRDLPELLEIVHGHKVHLWLHGHRHQAYHLPPTPEQPIPALCVGSGTMRDHWTYAIYTFDERKLLIEYRTFQPRPAHFETVKQLEVPLQLK